MAGTPLKLPGGLADLLNELGYIWPKSDEVKMFELGGKWVNFGGDLQEIHGQTRSPVLDITRENKGTDIDAFVKQWSQQDRGSEIVKDGGTGAIVVGAGLFLSAGLVLALKITVIVQLAILLVQIISAIASSVATFGASLAWIPVAKKLADMAINFILSKVITALMG